MHRRAIPVDMTQAALGPAPTPAPTRARRLTARGPLPMRRLLGRALLSGGIAGLALLLGFLWFLDAAAAVPEEPARQTDGIVVLTGGADRVRTGLALLAEGKAGRLLVSGAHRDVTLADLAAIAGLPVGTLQARVTVGHAARSTSGNAEETAAWARAEGIQSIRLVTAGYHMPRASLELRHVLPPEVVLVPHPVLPSGLRDSGAAARARTWTLLVGEYAKLIGAALGLGRLSS